MRAARLTCWVVALAISMHVACDKPKPLDETPTVPAVSTPVEQSSPVAFPPDVLIRRFHSFAELETALGTALPEPHGYEPAGDLIAQPAASPQLVRAIFPVDGRHIYLDYLLPPVWEDGPVNRLRARRMGNWDGWIITDDDIGKEFAFACASTATGPIWCVVNAPRLSDDALVGFVAAMR